MRSWRMLSHCPMLLRTVIVQGNHHLSMATVRVSSHCVGFGWCGSALHHIHRLGTFQTRFLVSARRPRLLWKSFILSHGWKNGEKWSKLVLLSLFVYVLWTYVYGLCSELVVYILTVANLQHVGNNSIYTISRFQPLGLLEPRNSNWVRLKVIKKADEWCKNFVFLWLVEQQSTPSHLIVYHYEDENVVLYTWEFYSEDESSWPFYINCYDTSISKQQQQFLLAIKKQTMYHEMYTWHDGRLPGRPRPIDAGRP